MEAKAETKSIKLSPRKVRLVADEVRNMSALKALSILSVTHKRAALVVAKTIKSALANASQNTKLSQEALMVSAIQVNAGPFQKRFRPSTRGRVHPYKKRTSILTIVLKEANGAKS